MFYINNFRRANVSHYIIQKGNCINNKCHTNTIFTLILLKCTIICIKCSPMPPHFTGREGAWYMVQCTVQWIVQRQKGPMPVPGGAGPVMMVTPDDGRRRGGMMSAEHARCRCPLVLNYNIRKIGINTPHLSSDDSSVLKLLPIT